MFNDYFLNIIDVSILQNNEANMVNTYLQNYIEANNRTFFIKPTDREEILSSAKKLLIKSHQDMTIFHQFYLKKL